MLADPLVYLMAAIMPPFLGGLVAGLASAKSEGMRNRQLWMPALMLLSLSLAMVGFFVVLQPMVKP